MADGQSHNLFSGLDNLAIFEDTPDPERRRAIMQAGLAMMQQQPGGGGFVSQVGGGIQTGLDSLDTQEQQRFNRGQLDFQNMITERGAVTDERRAGTGEVNAETGQQVAGTGQTQVENQDAQAKATLDEKVRQWNREGLDRAAQRGLDKAKAKYWDRMPEGGIGGRPSATDALFAEHVAKMNALWDIDQQKSPLEQQFSDKDDDILIDMAWRDITLRKGTAGNEALALMAVGTQDAAEVGVRAAAVADPGLASLANIATPEERTQADLAMKWTAEQWQEAIRTNDPIADRLLKLFPGLLRQAQATLGQ